MKRILSVAVFISLLFLSVFASGYNLTISTAIRTNSCNAGEVNVFSIYPLTNAHIASPMYYPNKVCISGENITSSTMRTSCNSTESPILRLYGFNNTHAGAPGSSYPNISCVQCPVNSTIRGLCVGNETSILSLSDTGMNAHVGEPGYYPYELCVIKTDPDVSSNTCNCTMGSGYWNLGGDIITCCEDDPNEYILTKQCSGDTCISNSSDDACCDNSTDCVYSNVCYSNSEIGDANSDSLNETCSLGNWTCVNSTINQSCSNLGYPSGYCIQDIGNCAPSYSLSFIPDNYYMPGEKARLNLTLEDKETDNITANVSIRFPNNTIAVENDSMSCSSEVCEYNFSQTNTSGDYDVRFYIKGGAHYLTPWNISAFVVSSLSLSVNLENERSGGGEAQNVSGTVWIEPQHTAKEDANITIELGDQTYPVCDISDNQGKYSCEITEPIYPREYKVNVTAISPGNIEGENYTYLRIISPERVQAAMRLNFSIGSQKDKVYLGTNTLAPGTYTKSELDKSYACVEDTSEFNENAFVSLIPTHGVRTITYRNKTSYYSIQAEEKMVENEFLLAFSQGKCSDVSNVYNQIIKENFLKLFSPAISYPTKEKYKLYIILDYPEKDLRGDLRFKEGNWNLFIENNGTFKGNPQISLKLLE